MPTDCLQNRQISLLHCLQTFCMGSLKGLSWGHVSPDSLLPAAPWCTCAALCKILHMAWVHSTYVASIGMLSQHDPKYVAWDDKQHPCMVWCTATALQPLRFTSIEGRTIV